MSQQTVRQQARRQAREMVDRRRRERVARDRRLEDLAVQVMMAIGGRDAAVADAECRAGDALREMTDVEGLPLREAVEWCDEQISVREATRLRRLADATDATDAATGSAAVPVAESGGVDTRVG